MIVWVGTKIIFTQEYVASIWCLHSFNSILIKGIFAILNC